MKIGDPCPKCNTPLERRAASFHWRGSYSDGAVCPPCRALWPIDGEEMEPLKPQYAGLEMVDGQIDQ